MEKLEIIIIILVCALAIACGYIATEKVEFCEVAKNESYQEGFNQGNEEGFNQGYFNGSRDYLIVLNQKKVFPCLNFQTGEYTQKEIGGLCQDGTS